MSESYKEVEDRIQEAIATYHQRSNTTVSKLAREFEVPYHRLNRRIQGKNSRSSREASGLKLSSEQEKALCVVLDKYDTTGHSLTVKSVPGIADEMLAAQHNNNSTSPPKVGKHWVNRFIKRHPEYFQRKRKPIELTRAEVKAEDIRSCYIQFKEVCARHGIQTSDIYNFDESGFQIGIGKERVVLTKRPYLRNTMPASCNRERLTVIETVSADGYFIPPMILLSGRIWYAAWSDNKLEGATTLSLSNSGYANDKILLDYIQHFDINTRARTQGSYRLQIFDGFGGHNTKEFIDYCKQNSIIPFCLVPHTSHLTQPLDVGLFQPMKYWHSEAIERAARAGCRSFNKVEFLHALPWIRTKTFSRKNILSAWEKAGYFPFDTEKVIKQLPNRPITPPPLQYRGQPPETPQSIRGLQKLASTIRERSRSPISPTVERFIRGSLIQANIAASTLNSLTNLHEYRRLREARQGDRRRLHIPKYGILTIDQARSAVIQRNEAEEVAFQLSVVREENRSKKATNQKTRLEKLQQLREANPPTSVPLLVDNSAFDRILEQSIRNRESIRYNFAARVQNSDSIAVTPYTDS